MSRKPREGSREWEKTLHLNPTYVRNHIQTLAKRAEQGSKQAVESLYAWLER